DQFPDSQYDQLLSHIDTEIEESKWRQTQDPDQFELMATKYNLLIDRYPQSPLTLRTMMLMGYLFLEKGQHLKAMSMFQRFIDQNPKSLEVPRAKLEIARAFIGMKKMDDAREALNAIHTQYPNTKEAVEAQFLLGDTYFLENRYGEAIQAYEESEKLYPKYVTQFPNLYNKAESLFWSQKYRAALESFRQFLQRFPQSTHGGYAMTRIGETLEILGAPVKKRDGAYLESIYRYRTSPGGNVARVRMAAQRMPEMKEKEIEKVREEIEDFRKRSHLAGLDSFTRLLIADGFFHRKEYDRSLPLLIEYYQKNPTSDQLPLFQQRIINHIVEKIRAVVDKHDSIQALQLYGQYSGNWLKGVDRLDLKYLLGRSFEIAGVPAEAEKFYRQVQEGMVRFQGSKEGEERAVFEKLPILNEVHVRLAKALIDQKKDADAEAEIKKAEGAADLTETAKVEAVEVQSRVAEARGNMRKAIELVSALIESWKGDAANVARAYLRQAELFSKLQDFSSAEKALNKIQNLDGEISDELRMSAMEVKGGIQLKKGDWQAAAKTWSELLEKASDSIGPAEVRFQLGKIYFEHGQMNEAKTTWSLLNRPETEFWYKLAQEKLQDSDWKSGYKKYIDRIPALNAKKNDGGKK
ncbi:MAG: tetratricopeptide repeat protein, partial [Bdellovibrionales bacterium]|nr:tetratricopeptide repeat protein [Bdellovibrionales bacterium]